MTGGWGPAVRLGTPLTGHTSPVYGIAFSPDGTLLATVGADNTVRLWDVARRRPAGEPLHGHTDLIHSVAFSRDGRILATGSRDRTVRLWDVAGRRPIGPLPGTGDLYASPPVYSVAFSPDGATLTADFASAVSLWSMPDRRYRGYVDQGIIGSIYAVAFEPREGRVLAVGAASRQVRLIDVETKRRVTRPWSATPPISSASRSARKGHCWPAAAATGPCACGTLTTAVSWELP